jgi:catechol 2,3-dioxygenase-like lactoylglutathione lyase family enzyme
MLQVQDVEASSRWYQSVLGLRSGHGGPDYEMLFDGDDFVLQLHPLDAHEHGIVQAGTDGSRGAGVSLWFEAIDRPAFAALVEQARASGATIVEEPHWNPLAHHHEATLRDPDGYVVVVNTPFEAGG